MAHDDAHVLVLQGLHKVGVGSWEGRNHRSTGLVCEVSTTNDAAHVLLLCSTV